MEAQIISVLAPLVLIGIGILLIALEIIVPLFFIIWFGFGFVICGLISFFYIFSDGLNQIALAFFISIILLIILRGKVLDYLNKNSKEIKTNFFDEEGKGIIKNGLVFYKGTFWEIDSKDNDFADGEKVLVKGTYKNLAKVEKIS